MPVGYLDSNTLISTIKREGMIPTSQNTFTDADFLAMANQEIRIGLVPSILQFHEEYFTRDSGDITLVANQSNYAIPYRAVGGKFRALFYRDTNGNLRSMSRISPDDRPMYQDSAFENNFLYFYIQGNEVVLVPGVGATPTGSLVFTYFLRPNELVDDSRTSLIKSIAAGATTTTYTVDSIPQNLTAFDQDGITLTGFSTSSKLDIMQSRSGHKTINFDVVPTMIDVTNLQITFNNSDLSSSVVVGDYIAFAGECIIPQIPSDLHDVLAQRVILKCCSALGDAQGVTIATGKLGEMEKNTGMLVDNRSEGNPQKVTNFKSTLRAAKFRYWGS